jgi:antitoxin YefM
MTYHVTAEYAKANFDEVLARASQDVEGVLIVVDGKSYVLIEQQKLAAQDETDETAELLKDPTLLADLAAAREEYRKGETLSMEQIFGKS